MRRTSGACQDRPAVVVPVDYQVCVSQEANYERDKQGRYRRRILDEKPACGFRLIAKCMKETPYLPEYFQRAGEYEGEGIRSKEGWWGR